MTQIGLIALGGALGALSRYGLAQWVASFTLRSFPFGTILVNILGSLLIGVAYVVFLDRGQWAMQGQALLIVGFLGAFTTFSTFSLDTLLLVQQGRLVTAAGYIIASVTVCILAAGLGIWAAKGLL